MELFWSTFGQHLLTKSYIFHVFLEFMESFQNSFFQNFSKKRSTVSQHFVTTSWFLSWMFQVNFFQISWPGDHIRDLEKKTKLFFFIFWHFSRFNRISKSISEILLFFCEFSEKSNLFFFSKSLIWTSGHEIWRKETSNTQERNQ